MVVNEKENRTNTRHISFDFSSLDNPSDSPPIFRRNRSVDLSHTDSDYDNGSSSIFDDNDYQQDRISLVETSSQRKSNKKQVKSPDTIINI